MLHQMSFSTGSEAPRGWGGRSSTTTDALASFGELIRDLTYNLDTEAPLHSAEEVVDPTKDDMPDVNPDGFPAQVPERIALLEYGNEAPLHAVRMEAL